MGGARGGEWVEPGTRVGGAWGQEWVEPGDEATVL